MNVLAEVLDLLLPQSCAGCGRGSAALCGDCGRPLGSHPVRARPSPVPPDLPPVWAVTPYDGTTRQLITAHKERGRL
ncbi:ComF family protein, partial [Actinomadura kijaniata]